MYIYSIAAHPI